MRIALALLSGIVLALVAAGPAAAQSALYPGTWENVDVRTRGIVRIVIEDRPPAGLVVQAFGACSPTPCDWGRADGHLYGTRVDANLQQTAQVATAIYTTGFSVTTLVMRRSRASANQRLTVQVFTRFTDNSGRSAYTDTQVFAPAK